MKINNELIGKFVIADIGENKNWVTYSGGNKGELNYYRDVYSTVTGGLLYSYGESCKVEDINEENHTVTLSNDNIDDRDFPSTFTISYEQFYSDFIVSGIN